MQQTDAEFCTERKATCGAVRDYDNCNVQRTVSCGTCTASMVCGASGKPNECGCVATTASVACQSAGYECGALATRDGCGNPVSVYCGHCMSPKECGVEGVPGRCGCGTDIALACNNAGLDCGPLTVTDRCYVNRTINCGTCTAPQTCGGGGTPGRCGQCQPRSDADICASRGAECGTLFAVDNCGTLRTVSCPACPMGRTCAGGGMANACSPLPLCTGDTHPPGAAGVLALPALSAFEPLCDGEVVIGNATTNSIEIIEVTTGIRRSRVQLNARPNRIALNRQTGVLFATLVGSTSLARIDLQTRAVMLIPTNGVASDVTLDTQGRAWAIVSSPPTLYVTDPNGTVISTQTMAFPAAFVAIAPAADRLLAVDRVGYVDQYAVDPTTAMITYAQTTNVGTNCDHAEISPDGNHLAVSCGHGNTLFYDTLDYAPKDLSTTYGAWAVGAYPTNGRFSTDSTRFISSTSRGLRLFDVALHTQLAAWPPNQVGWSPCSYGHMDWAALSRGRRTAFGASVCGFNDDSGIVYWWPAP